MRDWHAMAIEVRRLYTSRKADRVVVDDGLWAECWREVLAR